jgi:hypothetical protein
MSCGRYLFSFREGVRKCGMRKLHVITDFEFCEHFSTILRVFIPCIVMKNCSQFISPTKCTIVHIYYVYHCDMFWRSEHHLHGAHNAKLKLTVSRHATYL